MKSEFGADTRLIQGRNGVFEVTVDEKLVFSKRQLGRFPDPDEVAKAIRDR